MVPNTINGDKTDSLADSMATEFQIQWPQLPAASQLPAAPA